MAQGYDRNTHVEVQLDMIKGHPEVMGHSVFDKATFGQARSEGTAKDAAEAQSKDTSDDVAEARSRDTFDEVPMDVVPPVEVKRDNAAREPELRKGVESYRSVHALCQRHNE